MPVFPSCEDGVISREIDLRLRKRAVRIVLEHRSECRLNGRTIAAVAGSDGLGAERVFVAEIDAGPTMGGPMKGTRRLSG